MSEPINDYRWYYGLGRDPERFKGGFATRFAAVTAGFAACSEDEEVITVIEGRPAVIDTSIFDTSKVMEDLQDHNEELADEDGDLGLDKRTRAQEVDLERRLAAVLQAWLTEHEIGRVHGFSDTRNTVLVTVPRGKVEAGAK